MCSGFTKVPIHHNVNSKVSGAGKSYLLILVGGYLPDKYVISLAGMSNKALLHGQGIQVFEDESTGEVHPVRPYIREIQGLIPWETIADGSGRGIINDFDAWEDPESWVDGYIDMVKKAGKYYHENMMNQWKWLGPKYVEYMAEKYNRNH